MLLFLRFLFFICIFSKEMKQEEFDGDFNQKILNEIHLYYTAQNLSPLIKKK